MYQPCASDTVGDGCIVRGSGLQSGTGPFLPHTARCQPIYQALEDQVLVDDVGLRLYSRFSTMEFSGKRPSLSASHRSAA
ncbi:hypothetical protein AQJ64_42810 [Streptomyces griseoruber]|uniref:Uncharacterized protein n=1 Tax=Streptomyces griseoruber TaxID=1943 RepID=A0A117R7F5_9ACTN|nr:hypothetical protein AQJ64_42810 [Streptomyces griseoruber]